ncbi:MAG: signal peptidase II [Actinomycetota bacterium]
MVRRSRLIALGAAVVALDQITKSLVVSGLREGESVRVIGDFLRLSHIRNSGAAFGALRGFSGLIALGALVGVIVFIAIVVKQPGLRTGIGAALVAAGATGNLVDRFVRGPIGRGTVVDFVDFRFWPAFNVADSAITIGALILVWVGMTDRPRAKTHPGPGASPD